MTDTHVLHALNAKYARLSGEVRKLDQRAAKIRKDIAHIEATIRLFRADWNKADVASVAPRKPSRWGGRGQGLRIALEVLRDAAEPMTAKSIAREALQRRGIEIPDNKTLTAIADTFTGSLERRVGNGIDRIAGRPPRWRLTGKDGEPGGQWRNGSG